MKKQDDVILCDSCRKSKICIPLKKYGVRAVVCKKYIKRKLTKMGSLSINLHHGDRLFIIYLCRFQTVKVSLSLSTQSNPLFLKELKTGVDVRVYSPHGVPRDENESIYAGFLLSIIRSRSSIKRSDLTLALSIIHSEHFKKMDLPKKTIQSIDAFRKKYQEILIEEQRDRSESVIAYLESVNAIHFKDNRSVLQSSSDAPIDRGIMLNPDFPEIARILIGMSQDILYLSKMSKEEVDR